MSRPIAFVLSDAEYEAARKKLETVPVERWPSREMWEQVYISCRLKAMENGECEAAKYEGLSQ